MNNEIEPTTAGSASLGSSQDQVLSFPNGQRQLVRNVHAGFQCLTILVFFSCR